MAARGKQVAAGVADQNGFNNDDPAKAAIVFEKDLPGPPQIGEVLVRVKQRPINPSDLFCLRGCILPERLLSEHAGIYGGFKPKTYPAVVGLEGMGVVEAVGPDVQGFKPGQRVTACPWPTEGGEGTWQQLVLVPARSLVAVPDNVQDYQAAQFLINPVTAYGFLEALAVPEGDWLLQNAANSVLGKELICMAKKRGTKVINVVRRADVVQELKDLGADEVVVVTEEDLPKRVAEITQGRGAYAVINPIGGEVNIPLTKSLRDGGTLYIYSLFLDNVVVPMQDLHFRRINVRGFWLKQWLEALPDDMARHAALKQVG
eukprot:jgi/Astpho2/7394/Aster-x0316